MKQIDKEVKMKSKVVEVIQVPVLETADELAALDLKVLLDLVNRQTATDMANQARSKHREAQPGKTKRKETALNIVWTTTFADGETGLQKVQAIAAMPESERKAALETLLNSPEVQAEVDKRLGPLKAA